MLRLVKSVSDLPADFCDFCDLVYGACENRSSDVTNLFNNGGFIYLNEAINNRTIGCCFIYPIYLIDNGDSDYKWYTSLPIGELSVQPLFRMFGDTIICIQDKELEGVSNKYKVFEFLNFWSKCDGFQMPRITDSGYCHKNAYGYVLMDG